MRHIRAFLSTLILLLMATTMSIGQGTATYVPSQIGDISGLSTSLAAKPNKANWFQPRSTSLRKPPVALWSRPVGTGLFTSVDTSGTSRCFFQSAMACHDLEVLFANYQSFSSGEIPSPNSIAVSGTLEYPSGTFYRLTFGGRNTVVIDPYGFAKSDTLSINIPNGAQYWIRTYFQLQAPPGALTVTAGTGGSLAAANYYYKITTVGATGESGPSAEASAAVSATGTATLALPVISQAHTAINIYRSTSTGAEVYLASVPPYTRSWTDAGVLTAGSSSPPTAQVLPVGPGAVGSFRSGEGINYPAGGGAGTDQTTTANITWFSNVNNLCYSAMAILGVPDTGYSTPVVAVVGDSIAAGQNDGVLSGGDRGFIVRALQGANIPYYLVAKASEQCASVSPAESATGFRSRMFVIEGCTDVVCEYGTNDLFATRSLATLKSDTLAFWTSLAKRGVRVWATTLVPRTSSSDNWATAANQTPLSMESNRVGYNDWLRDTSASGAKAQSGGALTGVFDTAAPVEVNSAGVVTLDGGRWMTNGTALGFCDNIGTHPSALATAIMMTAIDTTKFVAN